MPSPQCEFVKQNGQQCRHRIEVGTKLCWQHTRGLRARWHALPRNKTLTFRIGLVSLILSVIAIGLYLRPKMGITFSEFLNPTDAFSGAFQVKNAGEFLSLNKGKVGCDGQAKFIVTGLSAPRTVIPKFLVGVDSWDSPGPSKSLTTYCNVKFDTVPAVPLEISEITITIKSSYSVALWPFRLHYQQSFRYRKGKDGQLHWLPNG